MLEGGKKIHSDIEKIKIEISFLTKIGYSFLLHDDFTIILENNEVELQLCYVPFDESSTLNLRFKQSKEDPLYLHSIGHYIASDNEINYEEYKQKLTSKFNKLKAGLFYIQKFKQKFLNEEYCNMMRKKINFAD